MHPRRDQKCEQTLPSKKVQDKGNNGANNQTRGQREIKTVALSLNGYISRQMTQPGDLSRQCENNADAHENDSEQDQSFSNTRH